MAKKESVRRGPAGREATVVWLRQDLRLSDHPALAWAVERGGPIIPVYIWSPEEEGPWAPGAVARAALAVILEGLERELLARGSRLVLRRGPAGEALLDLAREARAGAVCWSRRYEPAARAQEARVERILGSEGVEARGFPGTLLVEPQELRTRAGGPYKVFTPFYRELLARHDPEPPLACPRRVAPPGRWPRGLAIEELGPVAAGVPPLPGAGSLDLTEPSAQRRLRGFLERRVAAYAEERDRLDLEGTSRLSAALHFGLISPHQVWAAARSGRTERAARSARPQRSERAARSARPARSERLARSARPGRSAQFAAPEGSAARGSAGGTARERGARTAGARIGMAGRGDALSGIDAFLRQLCWREFAHHLLHHFPHTPEEPLRPEFAAFPWIADPRRERAWREGRTGYPVVDAAMAELRSTGWMHNRARLIVASFLVKDLLIPWQVGARWFWETLADADLADNTLGWQWTAGCGADAAPFFRIFNPSLQGRRFDPRGDYVRRFVPELAAIPAAHIHAPWEAPAGVLAAARVRLGRDYPRPIVDHGEARERALEALEAVDAGAGRQREAPEAPGRTPDAGRGLRRSRRRRP
ncbi:MAG: deoxyribodipyrimidine photo-lyase [Candidatus Eisenbacteria bacterium]|uniref:Deoxyribodipyrimidine photo-lyase n=1 Tax=Eiseniibacteriota bacterium TaxID=2212470 RepID=A0A937X892_UNCEI|nr:deoxyribodipyrimidine photo-lyase [Candidatus Eisenbacteria bacterium]